MIRISQVRVVDEEGNQLGVMPTPRALQLAQERGYDLVEVAPRASPPVTRLLDYGQFKYEQARKEKEARRHQRSVEFKEVRLRVKIGKGDFDTKVRRAIGFLDDGDRVKVAVQFRGREVSHAYIGRDLLDRFATMVAEHGTVDRPPILEGRSMSMVLTSSRKFGAQPAKVGTDQKPETDEQAAPESPAQATVEPAGSDSPEGTETQAATSTGG
jgi:translation initiation factor IF-3